MLIKAGVDGKQTVFLFSDNQIKEESFVEDINMILNTGDVPNIFPADEKADVIEKMQTVARVEVSKTPVRTMTVKALKYEIQKPSICRTTLFRYKFGGQMFRAITALKKCDFFVAIVTRTFAVVTNKKHN